MGARGGVFSPSCDASHLHPAPLQQHQAAHGRPSHHSSSAADALLFARAERLLLGSDLPRGSLGAAPALGRLGPRHACGLRPSTHSRLLGDCAAAGVNSRGELTARPGHQAGGPLATHERWPGCSRAGRQGAATRQAASAPHRPLGSPRSQGKRAGQFTRRGEEAARVFQQSQWALAGRALRNPSAACPCGSH